ncbi:hypothetical protein Dsin_014006 [Dipteronia sinensis]|uniref:Cytochrome P450 n=1 Tax=Dipteronia sinensis TaxID=43782 RepID=A0AAE0AL42_9ROSI|nr:hypothetical protein Dsin_033051 [Dipteronia sinensis]KAK3220036.1 hypothetical protein Dsin_014006 [Dipteronia sinensis]
MILSWTWTTFGVVSFLFLIQAFMWKSNAKAKRLPPGPRGLPIFGCLHLLGKYPHRDLHKLAQTYGSIMHLRLGLKPSIVVSSPQAAEQFLRTHDLVFASRPPLEASRYISYNQKNMIMAPYGSYWRTVRKMCTLELLSNVKINSFMSIRNEELDLLIEYVKEASGTVVDISAKVGSLNADMTCRMVFGKKYMDNEFDKRGFKAMIEEIMELAATFNLADYIPQIASLDLQGLTKRMKATAKVFDEFLEKVIDEHVQAQDENRTKDFVDLMLSLMESEDQTEYGMERDNIKAVLLDMLAAAMDTSASSIEWTLSELMKHPRVMKKVQKEIENVVGKDRMVKESDLDNFKYLDMVIKETFRIHPVAPLLVHESRKDCTVNGFHIPEKSRIFINTFAIGRDTNAWNDPDKFYPERFMGSNIDLRGHDFELIPFGSGRRSCPGMQLGLTVVRLVLAQLLHCFDWELPGGMVSTELDMAEHFGLVMSRAKHLSAIPTYRLNI